MKKTRTDLNKASRNAIRAIKIGNTGMILGYCIIGRFDLAIIAGAVLVGLNVIQWSFNA